MQPGRLSDRHDDHDLLRAIGEDHSLKYNTVPDVTVLDTHKRKYYYVDWHLAHELSQSTWWEVGFFFRQYTYNVSRKIGDALVLESLVAHGKAPGSGMVSLIPKKRKVDHFAMDNNAGASSSKHTV